MNAERRERVMEKEKRKKKKLQGRRAIMCVRERESRSRSFDACAFSRRIRFHETRSKYQRNRESGHLREQQLVASCGALFFIIRSHLRFEGVGTEET